MKILKSTTTILGNEIRLLANDNHKPILVIGVFHGEEPQGKYLIEKYAKIHVNVNIASEYRYQDILLDKKSLVIFICEQRVCIVDI